MSVIDAFWAAPPVTRTWVGSLVFISVLVQVQILSAYRVVFVLPALFQIPPEIWRIVTSCCLSFGFGILWDGYFIWTYGNYLETECPRFTTRPGQYFTYLIFVASLCMTINTALYGQMVFTETLIMALVYTWAQENRGKKVNFFFINIDSKYICAAMFCVKFVMDGPMSALQQATGWGVAHFYDFLTLYWPKFGNGKDHVQAPPFVQKWFAGRSRVVQTSAGVIYRPVAATSTGFSSSWGSRGSGRRLGGD